MSNKHEKRHCGRQLSLLHSRPKTPAWQSMDCAIRTEVTRLISRMLRQHRLRKMRHTNAGCQMHEKVKEMHLCGWPLQRSSCHRLRQGHLDHSAVHSPRFSGSDHLGHIRCREGMLLATDCSRSSDRSAQAVAPVHTPAGCDRVREMNWRPAQ